MTQDQNTGVDGALTDEEPVDGELVDGESGPYDPPHKGKGRQEPAPSDPPHKGGKGRRDRKHEITLSQSRYDAFSRLLSERYEKAGYVEVFGNLPMSSAIAANWYPPEVQKRQIANYTIPVYLIQPLILIENSTLSRVYTDYLVAARQQIADGFPVESIMGPDFVCVDLFFRDRVPSDAFDVSTWACELMKPFDDHNDFARLAGVLMNAYLMKVCTSCVSCRVSCADGGEWLIMPSAETYAKVPKLIRPTLAQRLIPHVPAIDVVPL